MKYTLINILLINYANIERRGLSSTKNVKFAQDLLQFFDGELELKADTKKLKFVKLVQN